jgi:hypothetical protein
MLVILTRLIADYAEGPLPLQGPPYIDLRACPGRVRIAVPCVHLVTIDRQSRYGTRTLNIPENEGIYQLYSVGYRPGEEGQEVVHRAWARESGKVLEAWVTLDKEARPDPAQVVTVRHGFPAKVIARVFLGEDYDLDYQEEIPREGESPSRFARL